MFQFIIQFTWTFQIGQKSYLINFSLIKSIHICQFSLFVVLFKLESFEWLAILRVFENIGNFLENRHFVKFHKKNPEKSFKCHNSKTIMTFLIVFFTLFHFFVKFFLRSPYSSTAFNIYQREHLPASRILKFDL